MLKNFLGSSKELVLKYRINKKYTSEERLREVQKIVTTEIVGKELQQKEGLLQLALEIGHPLKVRSEELKEELERALEIVLIELIKCRESSNKDANDLYICLEALNDKLYTVIAHKLRQLELDIQRARILKFMRPLALEQKIHKLLNITIERAYRCEKQEAKYVEELTQKYKRKTNHTKIALCLFVSYFSILYRQRDWFKRINKYQRFAIFGLAASAIVLYFR